MSADPEADQTDPVPGPEPAPPELAPPIENRFLFVDVAAQRAKQLRRGALPRLTELGTDVEAPRPERFFKLERVAMEEVTRRLIAYQLPDTDATPGGDA